MQQGPGPLERRFEVSSIPSSGAFTLSSSSEVSSSQNSSIIIIFPPIGAQYMYLAFITGMGQIKGPACVQSYIWIYNSRHRSWPMVDIWKTRVWMYGLPPDAS